MSNYRTEYNLTQTDLIQTDLIQTDLIQTDLTQIDLTQTDLIQTDLTQTDLTQTDLTQTDLTQTDLTQTDSIDGVLENFNLSDSDSDSDSNLDNENSLNNIKSHSEILDQLELQYFPEPYLSLAQFIISSIIGASTTFVVKNKKMNKLSELGEQFTYGEYLNIYYKYCNKTTTDDYVNELLTKLKITNDKDKITSILNKSNIYAKEIMDLILEQNLDLFNKYISYSETEFNIEKLGLELTQYLVPKIKFAKLSQII